MSLPNIPCLTNSTHKYNVHCFHPPPSNQSALLLYIPSCHQRPTTTFNIMEIEDDGGMYANQYSCFDIDPADYTGKKVLALPRCCQTRKGITDQRRVNDSVNRRDGRA